jgi:integrase
MPRSVKLTWQDGAEASGRAGRWRRKYKGKVYYFPGGRGKSDREAYDAAVAAWEAEKLKIDREAPRPHQRDHEAAIDQWEQVLAWCNRHGDGQHAEIAARKLESLRKRLAAPILSKLNRDDWFESLFDSPFASDPEWMAQLEKMVAAHDQWLAALPTVSVSIPVLPAPTPLPSSLPVAALPAPSRSRTLIQPSMDLDGSPRRIAKEIWRDRLETQKRKAASENQSVRAYIEKYLVQKGNLSGAGEVTAGRIYAVKLHLTHFQDYVGKDTAVGEIDGEVLVSYHAHLLGKTGTGGWSKATASHYMNTAKAFVRWLWRVEAIPALPRILDTKSADLKISVPLANPVVFTKDEIKCLLAAAPDRTRLYILLMLNCAMTQKDIADLLISEVDWSAGRIIRKRSKTADEENVPVVNYVLWPETIRLLRQERAAESQDRVLLNSNGSAIWSEKIVDGGKYQKTDNVKNAFDRLRKTKNIDKPLKSLKKTSATLLRNNRGFSGLESLFLGHAPQSMADKHYAGVPQELLDQAVTWLGQEYGIIAATDATKADESEAQPGDSAPSLEPPAAESAAEAESKPRTRRAGRGSKSSRPAASRRSKAKAAKGT